MKKYTLGLLLAFVSITLFAQNETEPNNSFNQSNTISFGETIQGFIGEVGDDDYYNFLVVEPGMIKLTVQNVPDNINLYAIIYNNDLPPSVIHRNRNSDNGLGYIIWVSTCQIGNHYLFLEDGGSQFNESETYSIKVEFIPFSSFDECECDNESFNTACPIGLGEIQEALIAPWFEFPIGSNIATKDKDFYKFIISEPGIIKLQVFNVPDNIGLDAFFYNPSQEQIWSDYTNNDGQGYTIWLSTCEIGEHYLYFRDGGNIAYGGSDFNAQQQYTFQIDTIHFSSVDNYECNNSFNSAFPINTCDTIEALINPWFGFNNSSNIPDRDVDFYQIELTSGTETDITIISVPTDVELCVTIYDSFQSQIENFNGNAGQSLNVSFITSDDGIYYIKVRDCGSNFDEEDQYIMTVGCNLISDVSDLGLNNGVNIVPNPVTNHFTIQSQSPIQNIQAFDAIGNQIFFQKEGSFQEIETDGWQRGIYFILIQTEAGLVSRKLIKQ